MSRESKEYEMIVEDCWLAVFDDAAGITAVSKHWRDATDHAEYPCNVVHCSPVMFSPESPRRGPLLEAIVELGTKTHVYRNGSNDEPDKDRAICSANLSKIRVVAEDATIKTLLNAKTDKLIFNDIQLDTGGTNEGDGDDINTMSITATCYIQI